MATRADRIDDDDRSPHEKRGDEATAPAAFPPRLVPEEPIEDAIERALARHREALEILARR